MRDLSTRRRVMRRLVDMALLLVLWATLVMLALKLLVGWATSSYAILATAMHTLVIAFTILISLQREYRVGFRRNHALPRSAKLLSHGDFSKGLQPSHGQLEIATCFLMWSLLGFGCLNTISFVIQRWQGNTGEVTFSIALVQLMGLMGLVSFCLALLARYVASITSSTKLASNAALMLKESWLNLLVLCSLFAVRYGHQWIDSALCFVICIFAISSAWQKLQRELPGLFRPQAIAPEAIAQQLQRIDGVLRCIPLCSQGLVGRQVRIDVQLLIHPEFDSLSNSIVQRSSQALQHRYGPVDVNFELINPDGSPRRRMSSQEIQGLASFDFLDLN